MVAQRTEMPTLPSEVLAGRLLGQVLTTGDLVVLFVAAVMFVTNAAAIQPAGPAAFGWWVLGGVCFFVPSILVVVLLGRAIPGEGAIYLWVRKALGPFWGFLAGFCAWWPGMLSLVAAGAAMLGFVGYAFPDSVGTWGVETQGLGIIAFLLVTGWLSTLRLRLVQNMINVVFVGCLLGIAVMVAAAVAHLLTGHHAEVNPAHWAAYRPSSATGMGLSNWSYFGLVTLALLGVEVPLNMGAEIRRPRSVQRHLLWGGVVVMVGYALASWAVMVTVPAAATSGSVTAPLPMAVTVAFGHTAGSIVALLFAAWMSAIAMVYHYSFGRLLFVPSLDRVLPEGLTKLNGRRVPANAQWTQVGIAIAIATLTFVVLPVIGIAGSPTDTQNKVYEVAQAAVTVEWCIAMLIMFATAVVIRRRYPDLLSRFRLGRRAPLWTCCTVGGVATVIAVLATFSGSWTPLISNDSFSLSILGAHVYWGTWSWWLFALTLIACGAVGVMFLVGRRVERGQPPVPVAMPTGTTRPAPSTEDSQRARVGVGAQPGGGA